MIAERLEVNDIQGIVRSAYGHLPAAAYLLLTIDANHRAAAGRWLAALSSQVTTCEKRAENEALNIAVGCAGLRKLGVPNKAIDTFNVAFVDGMTSKRRAAILGDLESRNGQDRAEATFPLRWGGSNTPVDALLMVYARDERSLTLRLKALVADADACHISSDALFAGVYPDRREHFGFVDGISQPGLEGASWAARHLADKRDTVKNGEVVLGYTNAYGYAAEAPLLGPNHELGRNGSYLVFRQMTQDVAGFNAFLEANTHGDPYERELLAAKVIGRWKNGAPLMKAPLAENPEYAVNAFDRAARRRANDFGFAEDPEGVRCPLGAHIRRANPRDASTLDTPAESLKRTARHRLLRRGRSYGPRIDDPAAQPNTERGLYFIALCADIERQFEFVQQTWINNRAFNDLDEVDPLVGRPSPHAQSTLTIQGPLVRRRITGMQNFVTFVGGAYFFVPSIAALRWLGKTCASEAAKQIAGLARMNGSSADGAHSSSCADSYTPNSTGASRPATGQ